MKWTLPILLMLFLTSCLEDINLDGIAQKHTVVEARVPLGEKAWVKVFETVSRTAPNVFPGVDNAVIILSDDLGNSETMVLEANGLYRSVSIAGTLNTRYFLEVSLGDETITGASLLPEQAVEVDSIWYEEETRDSSNLLIDAFVKYNFTTPPGAISHGLAKVYINGQQLETVHFFKNADAFNEFTVPSNTILGSGQEIKVELLRVEPQVYTYLRTMYDRSSNSSLLIAPVAPPDNPVTNLEGAVLGFFSAVAVGQKIIITQ